MIKNFDWFNLAGASVLKENSVNILASDSFTPCVYQAISKYSTGYAEYAGPRFNIKMPSYQYRKSHCGDKTVKRSSYLHNGIFYNGKMSSLYWIRALVLEGI